MTGVTSKFLNPNQPAFTLQLQMAMVSSMQFGSVSSHQLVRLFLRDINQLFCFKKTSEVPYDDECYFVVV